MKLSSKLVKGTVQCMWWDGGSYNGIVTSFSKVIEAQILESLLIGVRYRMLFNMQSVKFQVVCNKQ